MPETFTPTDDWLYRHIVEDSRVAMIYGDAVGIMRVWNKGAEEIFGWTAEEALGQSMDLVIPEKHRATHWEGYRARPQSFHQDANAITWRCRLVDSLEPNHAYLCPEFLYTFLVLDCGHDFG